MADIERMSIALPAPMAERVRHAVATGEYASASEVVRDALRLWQYREALRERDVKVLREHWEEGKESGTSGLLDTKGIMEDERRRR